MGVFCDNLKLCSTAALNCRTGQNKGRYCEKELSFLLVSLSIKIKAQVYSEGTKYWDLCLSKITIIMLAGVFNVLVSIFYRSVDFIIFQGTSRNLKEPQGTIFSN